MQQRIYQPLEIFWQGSCSDLITLNLMIDGKRLQHDTALHKLITAELEELLSSLFYEAQALVVEPMSAGYSGTGVLKVQPFYRHRGGGRKVVVKFGDVHMIEQEYDNYTKYVQWFIGDGRNTAFLSSQRTRNLGGIVCSFVGTSIDRIQSFGTFYYQHPVEQVEQALDHLFHHTCGPWYISHQSLWPLNLTENYQQLFHYKVGYIEQVISQLVASMQRKEQRFYRTVEGSDEYRLTNPLARLAKAEPLIRPTYVCTTHGDFNQHNLLLDDDGHTWLIDFQSTGPGHMLRDLAMLEAAIRFQVLRPQDATLEECFLMEKVLCSIKQFSQVEQLKKRFSTENAALAKAYRTTVHLRTLAGEMVGKGPIDDMSEYFIALLYSTLNTLRFSSLSEEQHQHALLSACLLADSLGLEEMTTQ